MASQDARNTAAAQELILDLFRIWDELDARRALPEELYVLELGVGQRRPGADLAGRVRRSSTAGTAGTTTSRLHYLMGDYSAHVLDRARQAVAHHGERVSALVVEATRPAISVGFLAGKAFLVYISNVYDNLPTDEVACIRGPDLPGRGPAPSCTAATPTRSPRRFGAAAGPSLSRSIGRLLRIGPELLSESLPGQFADPGQAVAFWQAAWEALRLAGTLRPAGGPGQLPAHALADRRDPAAADRSGRRRPDARQQRRARQLRRDAAAAAPVRPGQSATTCS